MRIVVLGASGKTGEQIVQRALAAGHTVTAVARDPSKLPFPASAALTCVSGDVFSAASLRPIFAGHDVVMSALGQRGLDPKNIYSAATAQILEAMGVAGVRRFVAVTADFDGCVMWLQGPVIVITRVVTLVDVLLQELCGEPRTLVVPQRDSPVCAQQDLR